MTAVTPKTALSIVIPVYNALQETLDCVASLLKSDAKDCAVYLMDDGSDWAVQETLRATFAEASNVKIISHFRNRGYTRNISMGVDQTSTPFVCILNSDTLLPKNWAVPLLAKMVSDRHLAGIGPMSNAASYQSVPDVVDLVRDGFSENDGLGFEPTQRAMVSDLLEVLGQGQFVDAPILNGFCTIFRRSALDAIGGFDIASYPQGYGEENDLCVRLKAEGYRLSIHLGVFVHHQKSKSFGSDRKKILSNEGSLTLARKFGPHLVPSLGDQLKESMPLEMMRRLTKIALDSSGGDIASPETLTAKSRNATVGPDAKARCIVLTGGASYHISKDKIQPASATQDTKILMNATLDGLKVNLPADVNLTVFSTSPISTALFSLSLWSVQQTVYVTEWRTGGDVAVTDGEPSVVWPDFWNMGDTYEVPFKHLYLDV